MTPSGPPTPPSDAPDEGRPSPDEVQARAAAFRPPPPTEGGRLGTVLMGATTFVLALVWGTALLAAELPTLPFPFVFVLSVLPWVALALLVWTFLLWTLLPDHRLGPWLLGLAAGLPVLWWGPAWADRGAPADDPSLGRPVTVLTWNVRRLWGGEDADERTALSCVGGLLAAEDPDVLVLQEVAPDDVVRLETALGPDLDCRTVPYQTARSRPADPGLAVCVAEASPWTLTVDGGARAFDGGGDWNHAQVTLSDGEASLEVLAAHLRPYRILHDPWNAWSAALDHADTIVAAQEHQARMLAARALAARHPAVVAGDFNSTRDTALHGRLRQVLVDAWERGAMGFGGTIDLLGWWPMRIDYIYATPDVAVIDARVVATGCSDHRPVVADLAVPTAP